jgi:RNA polymerase sigma-70 factor (ECF subfamily)
LPDLGDSPADVVARQDTAEVMRRAIARLPDKHQRVLLLRFFEDASLPEIAAALGCSVGTVKSRLHHALEKLRRMNLNLAELRGDT